MPFDSSNQTPAFAAAVALFAAGLVATGWLAWRRRQLAKAEERERYAVAERLQAALDRIDIGVVLLNPDTRAEFINRAYRRYFALPDDRADGKPPLIALMYHGRDTRAYELPDDEIDNFIARRVELVRAGDATPVIVRLSTGQVLRMSCTVLPNGGRMLSYTPVTELVRHSDDLADRDYYLAMRDADVFAHGHLHAAE